MVKVTITAALEAERNTVNCYGYHNLNKDLIRLLKDHNLSYLTLHVYSKEDALKAIAFCTSNQLEYKIGGNNHG